MQIFTVDFYKFLPLKLLQVFARLCLTHAAFSAYSFHRWKCGPILTFKSRESAID